MENVAIILALLGTVFVLIKLANQFKTGSDDGGSKYGSVMKILFNSIAFIILFSVPYAGMQIADNAGLNNLVTILEVITVPLAALFIIYVFITIWLYFEDVARLISGSKSEMEHDQFN